MKPIKDIRWPEDDTSNGKIRFPYTAGIGGGRSLIARAAAFGRSIGLTVDDFHDGGWLTRSGYLVAKGRVRELRHFAAVMSTFDQE